jgi:hypothetical protein
VLYEKGLIMPVLYPWVVKLFLMQNMELRKSSAPNWKILGHKYSFYETNISVLTSETIYIFFYSMGMSKEMIKGEYRYRNKLGCHEEGILLLVLLSWIVKLFLMQYMESNTTLAPITKSLASGIQFYLYSKGVSTHMWNNLYFNLLMGINTEMKKGCV